MNKKLTAEATAPAVESPASQQAISDHTETRALGVQLQRIALRLSELGHMKAGADALRAAVRVGRVRPGQVA